MQQKYFVIFFQIRFHVYSATSFPENFVSKVKQNMQSDPPNF